jgi:hypothetical protein
MVGTVKIEARNLSNPKFVDNFFKKDCLRKLGINYGLNYPILVIPQFGEAEL